MSRLAFGGFELDAATGELWKAGECLHIQEQPLRLLLCLLERPGELVGREELQKRMWPEGIHVDFEDGLNAAAWRLRQILGETPDKPRLVETVPRKGYRFVGQVQPLPGQAPPESGSFPMPVFRPDSGPILRSRRGELRPRRSWRPAALVLGLAATAAVAWMAHRPQPLTLEVTALVNATGDPALDYFATALTRQVRQDLAAERDLSVVAVEAFGGGRGDRALTDGLRVMWSLSREGIGYRIPVALTDGEGRVQRSEAFEVPPEELHDAHRRITAYLASRARAGRKGLTPAAAGVPAAGES